MIEQVYRRADEFDCMHFHLDYYAVLAVVASADPFVTTLHGRLDLPEHQPLFSPSRRVPVVSISDAQRRPVPHANFVATVHHGLPEICCGRSRRFRPISPSSAASRQKSGSTPPSTSRRRCGLPLKIAAKVDRADEDYFTRRHRPCWRSGRGFRRRNRRRPKAGFPERRHGSAGAHRLAGAVRNGDDRGHGVRRPVVAFNRGFGSPKSSRMA